MDKDTLVVISGGFDPIHVGHVRMIREAKKLGSRLCIIVNNDIWLKNKKGYAFMPQEERIEILQSFCTDEDFVLASLHKEGFKDRSICQELRVIRKNYDENIIFANGGDRVADNVPEIEVCKALNIKMIFNVGGEKIQSSSELVKRSKDKNNG